MTNLGHPLSFSCHVADSNMAPGFHIRGLNGGEVGCLTLARHCLCLSMGAGCRLWAVGSFVFIFGCSLSSLVVLVVIVAHDTSPLVVPLLVVCCGCRWLMVAVSSSGCWGWW